MQPVSLLETVPADYHDVQSICIKMIGLMKYCSQSLIPSQKNKDFVTNYQLVFIFCVNLSYGSTLTFFCLGLVAYSRNYPSWLQS